MLRAILHSFLLFATASAFSLGDIKHFLVIFFENRSFNHIFGCAAAKGLLPGVDGLKAGMGNYKDPSDPSSGFIDALEQCGKAEYVCSHSPDHSFPGTQQQIFGGACDAACAADCATRGTCPNETMGGYAYNSRTHNYSSMHAFNPEQLPVKIALAQEFALFNNFYESMPGPSQPNHMFAQSATACGEARAYVRPKASANQTSTVSISPENSYAEAGPGPVARPGKRASSAELAGSRLGSRVPAMRTKGHGVSSSATAWPTTTMKSGVCSKYG